MATGEQGPPAAGGTNRPLLPTWQKILLGLLALPLLPCLIVLAMGLAPTLCARIMDRSRAKELTLTIGLPNLCGCLPALVRLWSSGQTFSAAWEVLADPFVWASAFGAAALGWLIYLMMPPLVAVYYATNSQARQRNLKALQKTLIEIWGEDVAGAEGS